MENFGKWQETARSLSVILVRSMSFENSSRGQMASATNPEASMITAPMMKPACALLIMREPIMVPMGWPVTMPPP